MKKLLLALITSGIFYTATAQYAQPKALAKIPFSTILSEKKAEQKTFTPKPRPQKINPATSAITCVPMGVSGNAFGSSFGVRTCLYADPDLNIITLTRKSNLTVDPSTGYIRGDFSTNAGASFTTDIGPLIVPSPPTGQGYGQGVIFKNPLFPTIPDSAFINYSAPATNGFSWNGFGHGTGRIGAPLNPTQVVDATLDLMFENKIITQTGIIWNMGLGYDTITSEYTDSLVLVKGTWNPTIRDFDYARNTIYAPVTLHYYTPGFLQNIICSRIAFSSNGLTGYTVMLAHDNYTFEPDSVYYPIVFKTTNGGVTWNPSIALQLDSIGVLLTGSVGSYTTGFELDMQVDANDNLHIILAAGQGYPTCSYCPWSILTTPGNWGIFDVYTLNGGTSWRASLLATPETFRGDFGALVEDSRPQISTNQAHDKLFFTWFDTDTLIYNSPPVPGNNNYAPDLHWRGYDVATNTWTATEQNLTAGTCADGACTFGLVANYGFTTGTNFTIPASYGQLTATDLDPVNHMYIYDATVSTLGWSSPGNTIGLKIYGSPSSVNETENQNSITVFPNPSSGEFRVSGLEFPVEAEVYNTLGQQVFSQTLNSKPATLNLSFLQKGIYFIRLTANGKSYSEKIIIQ